MNDINASTEQAVRFSTKQIQQLVSAAGVSKEDVRSAVRLQAVSPTNKRGFLHNLAYVHISKDPEAAKIHDPARRHQMINMNALDLQSTWMGDKGVVGMVGLGREQGLSGKIEREEPKFLAWLDRVRSFVGSEPAPAPSPRM